MYGTKTSVISGISITDKRNPNTSLSNTENESQNLSLAQRRSAHLPKLTELSSTLSDANFSSNDPHSQVCQFFYFRAHFRHLLAISNRITKRFNFCSMLCCFFHFLFIRFLNFDKCSCKWRWRHLIW